MNNRARAAAMLNAAGQLRRRQHLYPWPSWSECIEVKHMIRRAKHIRLGIA